MKPTVSLLALALGAAFAGAAQSAETVRYVLLVDDGKKAGEQVVEHGDDGKTKVHYIFKDNGRGPELERPRPPSSSSGGGAAGFGSVGTAVVRKRLSPYTIGVETPRPGSATFQRTPFSSLHTRAAAPGATPFALGPRQCGQCAASSPEERNARRSDSVVIGGLRAEGVEVRHVAPGSRAAGAQHTARARRARGRKTLLVRRAKSPGEPGLFRDEPPGDPGAIL